MQKELIDNLFELVYSNLYSSESRILETALKNRFIGFRSEIEFEQLCKKLSKNTLNGGFLIPLRNRQKTLNSPVYFTIDSKDVNEYKELYSKLNIGNFSKLLYIKFENSSIETWQKMSPPNLQKDLPIPKFKIYDFQYYDFIEVNTDEYSLKELTQLFTKKTVRFEQKLKLNNETTEVIKEYLNQYSIKELISIYVNRLVFDGYIGMNYYKGIPSDIDLIVQEKSGGKTTEIKFYEIKEKDLSKTHPIGFGIDVQRFFDCLAISKKIGVRYIYVVRHVNNQKERSFIEWRHIDFIEFEKQYDSNITKNGGTGMNTLSSGENPTYLLEEKYFHKV